MVFEGFAKPDFDGTRYSNPASFTNWTGVPGPADLKYKRYKTENGYIPDDEEILNKTLPVHRLEKFESSSPLYAAWIGHATMLVCLEGAKFITDPVWPKKSLLSMVRKSKRYRPPPMEIDDLPQLDFAFISHDHFDHLDLNSVRRISQQCPSMFWFVPAGTKNWMRHAGIQNNIEEMKWGESKTLTIRCVEYTIWCVPAQHWCQRSPLDRNTRLWSGWVVLGPNKRFYYSGDTGFCEQEFKKIGDRLGPFDLSAIPIGCFEPKWFMQSQHIGPEEAVAAHEAVQSKYTIGVHWGTFKMGAEHYLAPKEELKKLMDGRKGLNPFVTIEMGKIWEEGSEAESRTKQTTE